MSDVTPGVEDSMQVTGMRMTANTQQLNALQPPSHNSISYDGNPNETYSNMNENDGEGPQNSYVSNHAPGNNFLGIRSGSSALKNKQTFRNASNDRKSSCGGDSNNQNAGSPSHRGERGNNSLFHLQKIDNFRMGNNASKQTQSSVIVVD